MISLQHPHHWSLRGTVESLPKNTDQRPKITLCRAEGHFSEMLLKLPGPSISSVFSVSSMMLPKLNFTAGHAAGQQSQALLPATGAQLSRQKRPWVTKTTMRMQAQGPSESEGPSSTGILEDFNGPVKSVSPPSASSVDPENVESSDPYATKPTLELPKYVWRSSAAFIMAGQVIVRVLTGRIHWKNTLKQLSIVGPGSLGVSLLTACFVGMAFTIQFVKEFTRLGLTRSVGGVLALALARELSPVVTAIIMAGRVGSSFAAELGTMQVSEQTDSLRVLKTDPIDYLVTPRVLACSLALPVLTLICFSVGLAASIFLADAVFNVSANIILDSAARALQLRDMTSMMVKSFVFGGIIADISCAWGVTTLGGAKGVGESTTSAVVISLVCVFVADFVLSWLFFQGGGAGDSLKAAMG